METFTIEQLGLFITLMGGTLSAIIVACFKSRCSKIKTPCISCDRDTDSNKPPLKKVTETPPPPAEDTANDLP